MKTAQQEKSEQNVDVVQAQAKNTLTPNNKTIFQRKPIQRKAPNGDQLTQAKRNGLLSKIVSRTNSGHVVFVDVANEINGEIKAKKAANAALAASLINLAFVWIPGGVGNILGNLAETLGKSKNSAMFAAAYHLLDNKDKVASTILSLPKDKIMNNINVKGTSTSTELGFLNMMKEGFRLSIDALVSNFADNIDNREKVPDSMLIAMAAKWDPNVLKRGTLKAELSEHVKMWQNMVVPIGNTSLIRGTSTLMEHNVKGRRTTGLTWAQDGSKERLCLIEASSTGGPPTYKFIRFVSEDMKEMAISKAIKQPSQRYGIKTTDKRKIIQYPTKVPANTATR